MLHIYLIYFIKNISTSKETKSNLYRGVGRYNLIYPWKFRTKQSFCPVNSAKLLYTY